MTTASQLRVSCITAEVCRPLTTVTVVVSPGDVTVTTAVFELVQEHTRPVSVLPAASLGVAVMVNVEPVTTLDGTLETSTEATGTFVTDSTAKPDAVSGATAVAMMLVVPSDTDVARPVAGSTVATAGDDELHVTLRPAIAFPAASLRTAVATEVCCIRIAGADSDTAMVAASGATVTVA